MFRTPGSVTITNTGTYSSDSRTVRVTSSSNMERAERDPVGEITGWIKAESKGLYVYVGDGHTQSEELTGLVIKSGSGTLESPFVTPLYVFKSGEKVSFQHIKNPVIMRIFDILQSPIILRLRRKIQ